MRASPVELRGLRLSSGGQPVKNALTLSGIKKRGDVGALAATVLNPPAMVEESYYDVTLARWIGEHQR
jgi:hypothetical protein